MSTPPVGGNTHSPGAVTTPSGGQGGQLPAENEPLVTVLVVTRNRPDSLSRLLASVQAQTYRNIQFVIVDDASSSPTKPALLEMDYIRIPDSRGKCYANNQGLPLARGKYVFQFDDDVEISDPTLMARAVALAENHPTVGVIGFRQLTPERTVHYMQPASVETPHFVAVFFAYGCLMRRDALHAAGPFEELLGYYYEEVELALRIRDAGYSILYDPGLSVVHYQDDRGRNWKRINRLVYRNACFTVLLRFPKRYMVAAVVANLYRAGRIRQPGGQRDLWSPLSILGQLLVQLPALIRSRTRLKVGTVQQHRAINRQPQPA